VSTISVFGTTAVLTTTIKFHNLDVQHACTMKRYAISTGSLAEAATGAERSRRVRVPCDESRLASQ